MTPEEQGQEWVNTSRRGAAAKLLLDHELVREYFEGERERLIVRLEDPDSALQTVEFGDYDCLELLRGLRWLRKYLEQLVEEGIMAEHNMAKAHEPEEPMV